MIEVRIEKDSITEAGDRITTFVLKYPRFIHAEFMTHRVFSRNASSSRAIPAKKIIEEIKKSPVIPVRWIKNQPGMQGYSEIDNPEFAERTWLHAKDQAINFAEHLIDLGVHKSLVNRILEPWMHISVVCTATDFANFFSLRNHHMAEDNFQLLASKMEEAFKESTPTIKKPNEWHLPFVLEQEQLDFSIEDQIKFSVARCARVSYNKHDGTTPTPEEDIALHDKLVVQTPLHASPAEHQAQAPATYKHIKIISGNFIGWLQYRKTLLGENITKYRWEQEINV